MLYDDLLLHLWDPYIEVGGKGLVATILVAKTLSMIRGRLSAAKPLETALNLQLPIILDRTHKSLYDVHRSSRQLIDAMCSAKEIQAELKSPGATKEDKLRLWRDLFHCALYMLIVGPYIAAIEATVVAIRGAACVLVHHCHQHRANLKASARGGGGGGLAGAMLSTLVSQMLGQSGTIPFFEQVVAESDELLAVHLEHNVIPSLLNIASSSVSAHFPADAAAWDLKAMVSQATFTTAYAKARRQFEGEVPWSELFRNFAIVHPSSPSEASSLAALLPLSPEELRETDDYQQRELLRDFANQLLGSESVVNVILNAADANASRPIGGLGQSVRECRTYDAASRSAVLLQVILGVLKNAQQCVDEAPQVTRLQRAFCVELVRTSLPQ